MCYGRLSGFVLSKIIIIQYYRIVIIVAYRYSIFIVYRFSLYTFGEHAVPFLSFLDVR
jgi:hypothetical protein